MSDVLAGKSVIVTGGGTGIGAAWAAEAAATKHSNARRK